MNDRSPARRRLLFFITEDWFFVSHFIGMGIAAKKAGFDVAVATRVKDHAPLIEAAGLRLIPVESLRGATGALALLGAVLTSRRVILQERPDIVHAIALRCVLTGGIAARLCRVRGLLLAPTGLGFLWSSSSAKAKLARCLLRLAVQYVLDGKRSFFLFENPDDARALGLDPERAGRIALVRGAGVDPEAFPAQSLPEGDELRLALVARMIGSKRVGDAVEAVRLARAQGIRARLDIYGAPDPDNPDSLSPAQLASWSRLPGIVWHGPTRDVVSVWKNAHAAILLSTGEGLPRSLVEAAASARAIITTDEPGNRIVVQDGGNGFIVPAGNPAMAAQAIAGLAKDRVLLERMGHASRRHFENGFTLEAVTGKAVEIYEKLCAPSP